MVTLSVNFCLFWEDSSKEDVTFNLPAFLNTLTHSQGIDWDSPTVPCSFLNRGNNKISISIEGNNDHGIQGNWDIQESGTGGLVQLI